MWFLIDDLYQNSQDVVTWRGIFSEELHDQTGGQAGIILSTHLYKSYINKLLKMFEKSGLGVTIGSLYLGAPTCTDDILLIANNSFQSQVMLDLSVNYSVENKYSIHPVKCTVTPYIKHKQESAIHAHYQLMDKPMNITQSFSDLGQEQTAGRKTPNINLRNKLARNSSYALLGAGLHGSNGLNPKSSNKIITAYITPKLLYGLEVTRLNKGEMEQLEEFYRGILRSVQGLIDHVASEGVYLLLSNISLEDQLHIHCLTYTCPKSVHQIQAATIRVRLLTGGQSTDGQI